MVARSVPLLEALRHHEERRQKQNCKQVEAIMPLDTLRHAFAPKR